MPDFAYVAPTDAAPAVTDVRLDASELRLTVSPDVLELGGALASSVLAPLMQVGGCWGAGPVCPAAPPLAPGAKAFLLSLLCLA
jgi:hypothetical protein